MSVFTQQLKRYLRILYYDEWKKKIYIYIFKDADSKKIKNSFYY